MNRETYGDRDKHQGLTNLKRVKADEEKEVTEVKLLHKLLQAFQWNVATVPFMNL
jgi:hypothetical protein